MSFKSPPLAVVTSGHQPLLRRAVADQEGPVWLITDDPQAATRAAGRDDVECFEIPRGRGFARAAQHALELARDRGHGVVVLLNDDARLLPAARQWLVGAARQPGVAAAGAVLLEEDGHSVQSCGLRVRAGGGRVIAERPTAPPRGQPLPVQALPATALAVDVKAALGVGGFDVDRYPFYFEDVDLCLRLRRRGYRIVLVPEARAIHRGAATAGRGTRFATYHATRGQVALALGSGGGGLRGAALAALLSTMSLARGGDDPLTSRALGVFLGVRDGFSGQCTEHEMQGS
jgi:GT2 family glycosyltransferase